MARCTDCLVEIREWDVMPITNQQVATRYFLRLLDEDDYYPSRLVERGKAILLGLCERIEVEQPADLSALYVLTHAATEDFNALELEFDSAGSGLDTVAREEIGEDFWFIARAYGFHEADLSELIAAREW